MRKYEDLSKEEKQKLKTYWLIKGNLRLRCLVLLIPAFLAWILAIPLAMTMYLPMQIAAGALVVLGVSAELAIFIQLDRDQKYLVLAFDIDDTFEDIFNIQKTDTLNMKKTWKKVKE
jgi:hypothetical protein